MGRSSFEQILSYKNSTMADYLQYIEYELKLERLRKFRARSYILVFKNKKKLKKRIDIRRIHFIFECATIRLKFNYHLCIRWLEFCRKTKSWKQMEKALTLILHFYPDVVELWLYAAIWEINLQDNPYKAKIYIQQGIKQCKKSKHLWLQFFWLELKCISRKYRMFLSNHRKIFIKYELREKLTILLNCSKTLYKSSIYKLLSNLDLRIQHVMLVKTFENILWSDKDDKIFESIRYDYPSSEVASNVLSRRYLLKHNVYSSRKHIGRTFREYEIVAIFQNTTKIFEKIFSFLFENSTTIRKSYWFNNILLEYELNSFCKRGFKKKVPHALLEVMVNYLLLKGKNRHL